MWNIDLLCEETENKILTLYLLYIYMFIPTGL